MTEQNKNSITSTAPARRKNGKPGRPTKFSSATRSKILRLAAKGMPLSHVASACGFSHQTLINFRREKPEFESALARAISTGMEKRLSVIESAMDSQDESIRLRSSCWYLEHVFPDHFSKTRIEVEAIGQFDHAFVIPQETLDRIAESRAAHDRELNGNGSSAALPERTQ